MTGKSALLAILTLFAVAGCNQRASVPPDIDTPPPSPTMTSKIAKPTHTAALESSEPEEKVEHEDRASRAIVDKRFTVTQRKAIYTALGTADERAVAEAHKISPPPEHIYDNQADEAQYDRYQKVEGPLEEKYEAQVGQKYGMNKKQVDALAVEGWASHWPSPNGTGIDVPIK